MPDISVCITTLNHERYIEQCINSVLAQVGDYSVEILVGDDCSSDNTRALLSSLAEKSPTSVRLYFNPTRLGASENLKNLYANAKGKYIAQLDGDDYWLSEKLSKQMPIFDRGNVAAVYCNAHVMGANDEFLGVFNDAGDCSITLNNLLDSGNFLHTSSLLFSSAYKEVFLGIDCEFVDFRSHVILSSLGVLVHIGQPLTVYRWLVGGSMTNVSREKICVLTLDAINDAKKLGASESAIHRCMRKLIRVVLYDSLVSLNFSRVVRFHRQVASRHLVFGVRRFAFIYCYCLAIIPCFIFSHIVTREGKNKVFFNVHG